MLKGATIRGIEDTFGIPRATTNDILRWARHKSEHFHQSYLTSLSLKERLRIMVKEDKKPYTFRIDGTHIKVNLQYRDDGIDKTEYRSPKPNTRGKNCLNFVVVELMDGFTAAVLWPAPAKRSDSQVVAEAFNKNTNLLNYKEINAKFSKDDTGIGDCNFTTFTERGHQTQLMKPKYFTRLEKERNQEVTTLSQAITADLSGDRLGVEIHFGGIKNQFKPLSAKKGCFVYTAKTQWAHSFVANCFALENIHKFPERFEIPNPNDHEFFKTDNVEIEADALTQLQDTETPTAREKSILESLQQRSQHVDTLLARFGIADATGNEVITAVAVLDDDNVDVSAEVNKFLKKIYSKAL